MPKVNLVQWTEKNNRFVRVLKSSLVKEGKNYKSLMIRTGKSQGSIYKRYNDPETITVSELRGFIQELDISENDILDFLFLKRRDNQ